MEHFSLIQEGLGFHPLLIILLAAVGSFAACLILPRLHWFRTFTVDAPSDNPCHPAGRKSRAGGLAVVVAALLVSVFATGTISPWRPIILYLGGLLIVGLLDDLHPLTPGWKIILQIPLAFLVVLSIPRAAWVHTGVPWVLLQVGWVVVMTNAFNIVDVADGLLAGLALPALAAMGALLAVTGFNDIATISLAFTGALLGFLPFNVSPGRIMLGDSGSLPVGGLVAILVLLIPSQAAPGPTAQWALLLTGVVLLEVTQISWRRVRLGIPPWRGSPHHLVFWLVDRGLPLPWAVALLSFVQAVLLVPFGLATGSWLWLAPVGAALLILTLVPTLRRDAG